MKESLIALLTDFGTGDPYVAAMKGVILSIAPRARLTDITHDIPRHDTDSAAYTVRSVAPWYPARTIFVCVVDPGVGTSRRILCLRRKGQLFIAPDNGILNLVSDGTKGERWYSLNLPVRSGKVSPTFHGRDIFAPAAARLSRGVPVTALAKRVPPGPVRSLFIEVPDRTHIPVNGRILDIDHFGNIITNIRLRESMPEGLSVRIARRVLRRFCTAYEEGRGQQPFMIRGSTGLLEISVNRGDAAVLLNVRRGAAVVLES